MEAVTSSAAMEGQGIYLQNGHRKYLNEIRREAAYEKIGIATAVTMRTKIAFMS